MDIGEGTKSTPSIPPLHVPRRPLLPNPHQRKIRPQIHKQRFNAQRNRRQKQRGAATESTQSGGNQRGSVQLYGTTDIIRWQSHKIKGNKIGFFFFFLFFFGGNSGHKMVNLKIIGLQSGRCAPWPHRGGGGGDDDDMMRFQTDSLS